jgi:hypothetical protein
VDWENWHAEYDHPGSELELRLRLVQAHVAGWLDGIGDRRVKVVSACAGQGRDLIPVLAQSPRRGQVSTVLLELDEGNASAAEDLAHAAGLEDVEVRRTDAGDLDSYGGAAPADLVMFCGVFGNIPEADIRRTVAAIPALCAAGALVMWTRTRSEPDLTPAIRGWFTHAGLEEQAFEAPDGVLISVGVNRLSGLPPPMPEDRQLFTFVR